MGKKTNRVIFISILAILLMVLSTLTVLAYDGNSVVTIKNIHGGFSVDSNTGNTESDCCASFKKLKPGTSKEEKLLIKNNNKEKKRVRVFLSIMPHNSVNNRSSSSASLGESTDFREELLSKLHIEIKVEDEAVFYGGGNDSLKGRTPICSIPYGEELNASIKISADKEVDPSIIEQIDEYDWKITTEEDDLIYDKGNQLTICKLWNDGNENHKDDSITIYLKKNGKTCKSCVLTDENQWCHTFEGVSDEDNFDVEEINIKKKYQVKYKKDKKIIFILNKEDLPIDKPFVTPKSIAVENEWDIDNELDPESVEVSLFRDDEKIDTVTLNAKNDWSYKWNNLDEGHNFAVIKTDKDDSYIPTYCAIDNENGTRQVVITNRVGIVPDIDKKPYILYGVIGIVALILLISIIRFIRNW